ncbi:DUF3040 domain-containing protein [Gemmata massiliana]|uniref:DUF3040 domain-containing protein n=1 Tax=Gemmata massiliana TaxID=1210884 RepID=UPI0013A6E37A|nr:DUF3040 domain-containing protein [Gemmata massiliana]
MIAVPHVSGSGTISTTYRPITVTRGYSDTAGQMEISTRVAKQYWFWVREEKTGREIRVEYHAGIPTVRKGHRVSVIFVMDKESGSEAQVAIINHTSEESLLLQEPASALQHLKVESRWTESDPRFKDGHHTPQLTPFVNRHQNRILGGIAGSSLGLTAFLIGIKTAVVVIVVLGIAIALAGIGLLLGLASPHLTSKHTFDEFPTTIRCSVETEFAEMLRNYASHLHG